MVTYDFNTFVHDSVSNRPTHKLADVFLRKASAGDVLLADGAAYRVTGTNYSVFRGTSLNTRSIASDSFYTIKTDGDELALGSGHTFDTATLVRITSCTKCGGDTAFKDGAATPGITGVVCTECGHVQTTITDTAPG